MSVALSTLFLVVIFFQFVCILLLFGQHHPPETLFNQVVPIAGSATGSTEPDDADGPDGVAVAVLLHAPKWFQRRYTIMVQNMHNNLPPNWKIQIFYTGAGQSKFGIEINPGLKRWIEQGKVVLTAIPESLHKKKKKRIDLMKDPWIWNSMLADRVWIFGGNGVVCSNSVQNVSQFTSFDYIGSPWDHYNGLGGDGGMSIRSRSLMLKAIDFESPEDGTKLYNGALEDHFFMSRITEMMKMEKNSHWRIGSREDTKKFGAIGSQATAGVLTVSGTLPGLKHTDRDLFIRESCPEMKIFYPSIHNPSCFGAKVDKDRCSQSICALQEGHKGGC